jgi:tetratricopeptide (TPR) repeat protein
MAGVLGERPAPGLAAEVHRRSGGNPFFVQELARLLGGRAPAAGGLPLGVREAIAGRLERLGPDCVELLGAAAVAGPEVRPPLLARVAGLEPSAVLDLLERAARAGVLVAPAEPLGAWRFAHDLFREALEERLGAGRRARLHLAIARTLEAERAGGGAASAAQLAGHYALATGAGAAEEAVRWSALAAREASGRLAHEEAALHWRRVLRIRDAAPEAGGGNRIGTLLALGDADRRGGDMPAAREDYLRAADLARREGDAAGLAGAALGMHAVGTRMLQPDDELRGLLEEALAALGDRAEPAGLRPRVRASLARALAWSGRDLPRARELAERAVAEAEAGADRATQASCLLALHNAIWGPGTAAERQELASRIIALAKAAGDRELEVEARLLRAADLLELADPAFRAELGDFFHEAETLRQPRLRYLAVSRRAMLAVMAGRFDEAERRLEEAFALGSEIGEPDAAGVRAEQLWEVRSAQGRRMELAGDAAVSGLDPDSREALGFVLLAQLELGDLERVEAQAPQLLDELDPGELPRNQSWTVNLTYAAELAAAVGDAEACRRLYQALEPLRETTAVTTAAVTFKGAVAHHLGVLAAALGQREEAEAHLRRAVDLHRRLGARLDAAQHRGAGAPAGRGAGGARRRAGPRHVPARRRPVDARLGRHLGAAARRQRAGRHRHPAALPRPPGARRRAGRRRGRRAQPGGPAARRRRGARPARPPRVPPAPGRPRGGDRGGGRLGRHRPGGPRQVGAGRAGRRAGRRHRAGRPGQAPRRPVGARPQGRQRPHPRRDRPHRAGPPRARRSPARLDHHRHLVRLLPRLADLLGALSCRVWRDLATAGAHLSRAFQRQEGSGCAT